jgi:hypothetical protein
MSFMTAVEIIIDIGGMPIAVRTDSCEFVQILDARYGGFVNADVAPVFTFDVEIVPPGFITGSADLSVHFEGGRWILERGDFHAECDPAGRRGSIRQAAYPYAIDAALRIMHSLLLAQAGGLLVHAASAVRNGRAFLFAGVSGAGKTTMCRLAPPDVLLLTDEISYVRHTGDGIRETGNGKMPGARCQVSGEKKVSGARCQVSGERDWGLGEGQVSGARCQVPGKRDTGYGIRETGDRQVPGARCQVTGTSSNRTSTIANHQSPFSNADPRVSNPESPEPITNLKSPIANSQPPGPRPVSLTPDTWHLAPSPSPVSRIPQFYAFGTPFAGELGVPGENIRAPLAAIYLLAQGTENRMDEMGEAEAVRALLPNVLFFAHDQELVGRVFDIACELVARVPVQRLTFAPDPRVWEMIH